MGAILNFLTGGLGSLMSGIITPILTYLGKSQDTNLEAFKTGATIDSASYTAYLGYLIQINAARIAANSWWGARALYMMVGSAASLHVVLIFLDSSFTFGSGHYGSLGVAKLPADYFEFEKIVVYSLFGTAVLGPPASAVSAWFHKN